MIDSTSIHLRMDPTTPQIAQPSGLASKIYEVIEFIPSKCFDQFTEKVSDARRQGDIDPYTSVIADTMKLMGNSGYGSLIMNKENYQSELFLSLHQHCFFNKKSPRTALIY